MSRRHKWVPLADFPDRDDLRVCAREDCRISRRDYGETRYEYRGTEPSLKFIANQKRSWPAPPCGGTPK